MCGRRKGNVHGGLEFKLSMNLDPQLEKALDKLRSGGKKIGTPDTLGQQTVIPVDGVLLTPEKIFELAEMSPKT